MNGSWFLVGMSILAALTHSLVPDHWVPYVVIARAHHWTRQRTVWMAAVGAVAHLVSTAAVGLILALFFQSFLNRGGEIIEDLTGLLVVGIGGAFVWRGIVHAKRGQTHGDVCGHHERQADKEDSLLLGAVLGLRPCVEALPIFLAAASKGLPVAAATVLGWALASVLGMVVIVSIGRARLEKIRLGWLEQHAETLAGVTIIFVGLGVFLFGLLQG